MIRIPRIEKRYTDLFHHIGAGQWMVLGTIAAMMWLVTGPEDIQPWHTIGTWMFWGSFVTMILVMNVAESIYANYQTVPAKSAGYYWTVRNGHVEPARPGRHWGTDKDSLFVLYTATPMGFQFGDHNLTFYTFNWTVKCDRVTCEVAVGFVNWYQTLFTFGKDHEAILDFLKRSAERTDLPFQIVLPQPQAVS